jgi:hypothetical protein
VNGITGRVLAAAIAVAGTLVFAAPALAAPANDDFGSAQPITLPQTVPGDLTGATTETNEPTHSPLTPTQSVWYSWTSGALATKIKLAACQGNALASNVGVAIYTGSALGSLTQQGASGPNDCFLKLTTSPTTDYKIAVFNRFGNAGTFQLEFRTLDPPDNDDFVDAEQILGSLPQTVTGTNLDATVEPDEPGHGGSGQGSVWYRWTASATILVRLNACSTNGPGPVALAVYTGTDFASLDPVARFQSCRAYFSASAGMTYRVAVDTFGGLPEGPFSMQVRQAFPPANDNLANAQLIPGDTIQDISGTTVDATTEMNEPNHIVSGGPPGPPDLGPPASVWFMWTSGPVGGPVSIDGCNPAGGSLAVYTGDTYSNLSGVTPINGNCAQSFMAAPSTTYKIAVEGLGDGGAFVLNPTPAPPAPPGAGPTPSLSPAALGPTGQRAAALKKCKKRHGRAHKSCVKRAKRLPV